MVNFYKTINEAFDKRYDSNSKKPLTEASAAHAHPDMSKKAGSISSMILSNKDRIDNATSLQDLRAVVEDILSPLEGNAKVIEINGRLRAMKDHVKALQYIYNIILKGDNLGTIKTGKAKERSKNESVRSRRVNESSKRFDWDNLDVFEQTKIMKDFVRKYNGTKVFEDFADYIGVPVDDVIDLFTDAESRGFIQIPQEKQINSAYASTDIYESFRSRRVNESYGNIFSMPFAKYSKMSGYTEDDISLHPEKNVVRVYLLDLGDGEDGPYTGVEYDDGTFSVVGLGYDEDVNSKEKMKQIVLSGMDEIMGESFRNNSPKSLTENSNKIFKLDRNYSWSRDGKNHPLYPMVMDILDDMGFFMEVHDGYCVFLK